MLLNGVSVLAGRCKEGVDTFTRLLLDRYRKDIVPLFQQGFDYASERQKICSYLQMLCALPNRNW